MNFVEETGLNMAPDSVIRLIQVSHLNRLKTPAAAGEADAADCSRLGPSPSIQSDWKCDPMNFVEETLIMTLTPSD